MPESAPDLAAGPSGPAATPAAGGEPLLVARGLRKQYPGVLALDDVDLVIKPGELHGLLGENGAGKSTLIKVISGAVAPDAGTLLWDGGPLTLRNPADAVATGISVMQQHLSVLPTKTVAENVLISLGFPSRFGHIARKEGLRRTAEVLADMDLDIDPRARMGRLPVHQQRMVMIALAVARNARLVVMDEPTASLNAEEIEHVGQTVRELRSRGVAVLYVTHRLSEVSSGLDWVTVLRSGRTILSQSGDGLTEDQLFEAIAGSAGHVQRLRRSGASEAVLELENVTAEGVRGVSLSVPAGRVVGLTGAEGSGVRDLGLVLGGSRHPTAGAMRLFGSEYKPRSPRDALAGGVVYIAQDRASTGLFMRKSVRTNMTMTALSTGRMRRGGAMVDGRAERREVAEQIDGLKLAAPSQRTPVSSLSGGNQQKVLLGRALLCEPKLLILDEPTEGVDVGARREFFETVQRLADRGTTAIIISTDWEELPNVCDRIVVLRDGVQVGTVEGDDVTTDQLARLALGTEAVEETR